jgi:hypothetical protein
MAISTKDKARINLAKKRIEAGKEAALRPWVAKKPVGYKALALGQEKETPVYADKAIVQAAQGMVSPENKTFAHMTKAQAGLVNDNWVMHQDEKGNRFPVYKDNSGEYDPPSHVIKGTTSGRGSRRKA